MRSRLAQRIVRLRAAARFALGEGQPALAAMARLLARHECARWTVVTYLPFLWRPDAHIFLKPEVTRDFAALVPLAPRDQRFPSYLRLSLSNGVREAMPSPAQ